MILLQVFTSDQGLPFPESFAGMTGKQARVALLNTIDSVLLSPGALSMNSCPGTLSVFMQESHCTKMTTEEMSRARKPAHAPLG